MSGLLRLLFGPKSDLAARVAALERENGELRRGLDEAEFLMAQWRSELTQARGGLSGHVDDALDAKLFHLFSELAPALAPIARSPDAARALAVLERFGLKQDAAGGFDFRGRKIQ